MIPGTGLSVCPRIHYEASITYRMNKKDLSERDICSKFIGPLSSARAGTA